MDLAYIPSPSDSVWHLGPIPIRAYALCLLAGIVAACWIGEVRLRRRGAPKWAVLDLAVWAVPAGIIGGRLYHVFTSPDNYFGPEGDPMRILEVWKGGLGIPGAILLGGVGVWLGCRQLKLPFTMVADAIVPGIPVAQAIGRLGNWFNQELYGRPLDAWWAVQISAAEVRRQTPDYVGYTLFHPTFLYELLWNLGVALVVFLADRRVKFGAGRAVALYVALYGVGRFWIEGLRIDDAQDFLGLRLNQWTSIVVVVLAVAYLLLVRGTRQVFVLEGGERVTVAWNSAAAEETGYVDGVLPKGVVLETEAEALGRNEDDDPEDSSTEDDSTEDGSSEDAAADSAAADDEDSGDREPGGDASGEDPQAPADAGRTRDDD